MSWLFTKILWLLSLLPYFIWFGVSKLAYVLVFYFVGYRKEVVRKNLQNSFPAYPPEKIRRISKAFYKHFCTMLAENIKLISISNNRIAKQVQFLNVEVLNDLSKKNQNFIIVMGHYGNWEYLGALPLINKQLQHPIKFNAIYKVQSNRWIDQLLRTTRAKFGLNLITAEAVKDTLKNPTEATEAMVFLGDQSPSNAKRAHWMRFLNQDTAVLMGTERYAKIFDLPIVYLTIHRVGLARYNFDFSLVPINVTKAPKGTATSMHHKLLEIDIISNPAYWLWSHKRWKKKKPAEVTL